MKLNTKLDQGSWIDWEDGASFKLRPYPITQMEPADENDLQAQIKQTMKMFVYCVVEWKGLEDEETGKDIACNDKWKTYMFENNEAIRTFVMEAINKLMGVEDREQKN